MELLTYKKFADIEIAKAIGEELENNKIFYEIENTNTLFDPLFRLDNEQSNILLKIKPSDFENANKALLKFYESKIDEIDEDYYLFSFKNEELIKILQFPDEWGEFDYVLAKKILADRGSTIKENDISYLKSQRFENLEKPEKAGWELIIIGYLLAMLNVSYFFIPSLYNSAIFYKIMPFVLTLMIVWSLLYLKKTLPNGKQIYVYDKNSQKHGVYILCVLMIGGLKILYNLFID